MIIRTGAPVRVRDDLTGAMAYFNGRSAVVVGQTETYVIVQFENMGRWSFLPEELEQ